MAKFLQDVEPSDVPPESAKKGSFIDSKVRKWYPAAGDPTADKNWAKQTVRAYEDAQGKTPEGYLWYPAVHYTKANRSKNPEKPRGHDIEGIIIHTTEGWSGGGRTFMKGSRRASAHYGIERDGTITQSVLDKDRAWHAPGVNSWSIGIEHAGFAKDNPNSPDHLGFPLVQIKASAKLVAKLCRKYNIPINRKYIFGHREIGREGDRATAGNPGADGSGNHSDPGPYWKWDSYIRWVKWYYYRRYVFGLLAVAGIGALAYNVKKGNIKLPLPPRRKRNTQVKRKRRK